MGELRKKYNEQMPDYVGLGSYFVLGLVLRWFTCDSSMVSIARFSAIVFILTGIVLGLYSFVTRNRPPLTGIRKKIFEAGRGMLTGFSIGWGGLTALILAFHICG